MKSQFGHMQVNIDPKNLAFYKELFTFLGWSLLYEDDTMLGMGDANEVGLWFVDGLKKISNDYDGTGMNHLAISASRQSEVDEAVDYLKAHDIRPLFETPRHRPEFREDPSETYYQVMFESPDKVLFEIVYTGPINQ